MTKRTLTLMMILAAAVGLGGCVSKSEYESLQVELTECQEQKAQSEAQVITWERRFDRESERWEGMGASITEQLPRALSEIHDERQRILELVPEQVQAEVATYLEEYFATVMGGFDRLAADNREVRMQLDAYQKVLVKLGSDTEAISTSIDGALAQERGRVMKEGEKREAVASRLGELVATVTEFDGTRINCKSCPDRLKLNRKEREAVTAFHTDLVRRLSDLQSFAGEPQSYAGEEPGGEEPGGEEPGAAGDE